MGVDWRDHATERQIRGRGARPRTGAPADHRRAYKPTLPCESGRQQVQDKARSSGMDCKYSLHGQGGLPYRYFKCVTAGTSGTTEPAWDTTIGNQTTDGTVVWECYRALQVNGTVNTVTDRSNFSANLDSQDDPDGFFTFGVIKFTSGKNNGVEREVKQHTSSGANPQSFLLYEPLPFDLQAGDTFTVTAGCDKTLPHCRDKFNNTYNRRAEDFVPGQDALMKFGGQ